MPRKLSAKPKGLRSVTPYLSVRGGAEALDWYAKVMGAQVLDQERTPDGKIVHARMKLGDSIIMLSDDFSPPGPNAPENHVTLHYYTEDVDKLWKRALGAGATVGQPLADQFWGERYGSLTDPFGHNWSISMRIPMSKRQMASMREEAMKALG